MELSNIVSATVSSFINYALFIVTIMIVWYVIKFFMVAPPTKEEREATLQGQREAWGGAIKKAGEKQKVRKDEYEKKREQQRKRNLVSPAKLDIRRVIEAAEKAILHLDNTNLPKLRGRAMEAGEELHSLWTHLRMLRGKVEGGERQTVNNMITKVQAIQEIFLQNIKNTIPKEVGDEATWHQRMKAVRDKLKEIRQSSGAVFEELEQFHQ